MPAPLAWQRAGLVGCRGQRGFHLVCCRCTGRPMAGRAEQEAKCREIAASLAGDMAGEGLKGRTLTLKLKAATFEVWGRSGG